MARPARQAQILCGAGPPRPRTLRLARRRRGAGGRGAAPRRRVHVRLQARDDRLHREPSGLRSRESRRARRSTAPESRRRPCRSRSRRSAHRASPDRRPSSTTSTASPRRSTRPSGASRRLRVPPHHPRSELLRAPARASTADEIAITGTSTAPTIAPNTAYVNQLHGAPVSASDGAPRQPRQRSSQSTRRSSHRRQTPRTTVKQPTPK